MFPLFWSAKIFCLLFFRCRKGSRKRYVTFVQCMDVTAPSKSVEENSKFICAEMYACIQNTYNISGKELGV